MTRRVSGPSACEARATSDAVGFVDQVGWHDGGHAASGADFLSHRFGLSVVGAVMHRNGIAAPGEGQRPPDPRPPPVTRAAPRLSVGAAELVDVDRDDRDDEQGDGEQGHHGKRAS